MTLNYPTSFSSIENWCSANGITIDEGRKRFAQYAILRAIAGSRRLSSILVFKGGNALDFIWQENRSTTDLDFSVDMTPEALGDITSFGEQIKDVLGRSLVATTEQLGIVFTIQKVKQQPPGPDKTFVTFEISVGYALPDQDKLIQYMSVRGTSTQKIPVEISLNEAICADQSIDIQATNRLRVSTAEDIIAEKLRSLLQQPIRNRTRRQDLLDIAVHLVEQAPLDLLVVADFLLRKSAIRNVTVSRSAFRDPRVAEMAAQDYDALQTTTRKRFIPYDEAVTILLNFIETLPIPENPPTEQ